MQGVCRGRFSQNRRQSYRRPVADISAISINFVITRRTQSKEPTVFTRISAAPE